MGGTLSSGALWSHAAYEKYVHAFTTLRPDAPRCPVGTWGMLGPSALRWRLPEPSPGVSKSVHSLWASIYRQEAWEASPGLWLSEEIQEDEEEATPALGGQDGSAPCAQRPHLEA